MAAKDIYRQCALEKQTETGVKQHVAWIPSKFAKEGCVVGIRPTKDAPWDEGWTVKALYASMPFSELQIQRQAEKRWRDVLDVQRDEDEDECETV